MGFVSGSLISRTHVIVKKRRDAQEKVVGPRLREVGTFVESVEDAVVVGERNRQLKPYEKLLQKFNYQKALDSVLRTRNPLAIVAVLEELNFRNGLSIALAGRNESSSRFCLLQQSIYQTRATPSSLCWSSTMC